MARAGLCSRREAERWILAGRVTVNGLPLTNPATNVTKDCEVRVDGTKLGLPEATTLWRYHKSKGFLTSNRDPQGRPTIFDTLPKTMERVISVGRLDMNSEGLLLLTNDGELARKLELPSTGLKRKYRARVHGIVDPVKLDRLKNGITLDGIRYGPISVLLDRRGGHNSWLSVELKEGKNREIRNVLREIGLQVNRLIRTDYGPFSLGSLPAGKVAEVPRSKLKSQKLLS